MMFQSCDEIDPDYEPDTSVDDTIDIDDTLVENLNSNNDIVQRRSKRIPKPRNFDVAVTHMCGLDNGDFDPITVQEALKCPNRANWKLAMDSEMNSLIESNTWFLCNLPKDKKAISSKWIFKSKTDNEGNVIRHKARLLAKGCAQKKGIDFMETFSPVVRYNSIRFLISLAVQFNLEITQTDAITAFLQGDFEEDVYMHQPEEFDDGSGRVCKLNKSMYGLKQASRQWNIKLRQVLLDAGFKQSRVDPCIYFRIAGESMIFLALYVAICLFSGITSK